MNFNLIPSDLNSLVLINAVILILLSFIFLLVYQSVIIVPPSASVEINGAIDNIFKVARHKKPFTLTLEPDYHLGLKYQIKIYLFLSL